MTSDNAEKGYSEDERAARYQAIGQAFTPAVPITHRDLFAGRRDQMQQLIEVTAQPGQHAAIYGERGVGKTSLAAVMAEILSPNVTTVKVNCSAQDTFLQAWVRVLDDIIYLARRQGPGFLSEQVEERKGAAAFLRSTKEATPEDVRRALALISQARPVVLFFDEFDRISDRTIKAAFADTLKSLSDHVVKTTVILVGVADTVDDLIAEHRSIERALAQIPMPRMSPDELDQIIDRGLASAGMGIDRAAQRSITRLSQGLPHYTHLLTQNAAYAAIDRGKQTVQSPDLQRAVTEALRRATQSVTEAYHQATASNRAESLYRQVLLACALTHTDERGFFAPSDVREPLSKIMGKPVDIPAFAQHLKAFSGDGKREPLLQKRGTTRRFKYRFINPLLQPFVLMKGVEEGMIGTDDLVGTVSGHIV